MKNLSLDLETYSSVDLSKSGLYRYAESPDFSILLFGYSVDGGEVQVVDLASGETLPEEILDALSDDNVQKWAFNSSFERVCLSRYLGVKYLSPEAWRCTMVWAAYMGLPLSLMGVGAVLGLEKQKLAEGKDLIKYFCAPCAPTKSNGQRTRNLPEHAPEKWATFKAYNIRDVETEMAIQARLAKFPVPDFVWDEYHLDQEINDRGVALDMTLVRNAIAADAQSRARLTQLIKEITELDNPNSVAQMKEWLADHGLETDTLGKKVVAELLKTAPEPLGSALTLRQQLAKSSAKKYQAMENAVCGDGRAHGMFQFYGANRTGRWAGRLIQMQNLYQNHMPDLEQARALVRASDFSTLELLYDSVPEVLSELIRTAFVPRPGHKFIVADFSSIEAVVLAWLAGEQWTLDAYAAKRDLYIENAEIMFGVPKGSVDKRSPLRQKSKIAVLACGYGGSVGALKAFGALEMGLKEEDLKPLVDAWRATNPSIVRLWWDVDKAAKQVVRDRTCTETHGLRFSYQSGMLFITLPSGRRLCYVKPHVGANQFGSDCVTYEGVGTAKRWERIESYGPKLVENCVAEDTLVVTNSGLIPIQNITAQHRIWDGVEFVAHDGLIHQGTQPAVSVNGVMMTPDHKILTTKGWMDCAKAGGFNWEKVPLPDCVGTSGEYKGWENAMVMPVRMRNYKDHPRKASDFKEKSSEVLWMYEGTLDIRSENDPWIEPSSSIRSMAFDETAMRGRESSSLPQLWRARDNGMPRVARKLPNILGGHGADIPAWSGFGPHRQQSGIQSEQLPLDDTQEQQSKSSFESEDQDAVRRDDNWSACGADGDWSNDVALPPGPQLADRIIISDTGCTKPVYDIRNCGPRHRFVVWHDGKGRVVSNCVQAISRDILCYAMKTLHCCDIVMHIHDEIVIEADLRVSVDALCEQMSRTPPWAEGLLLRSDGYECSFYKKS